jgi:DNA (cytosine-5)-methyltransferase 1
VRDIIGEHNGFKKIKHGSKDSSDFMHSAASLTDINLKRLNYVKKDGGDRSGFAKNAELQLPCFIGKDDSFKDTYGRLWWDKPSPTITTKFSSISNGRFAHPEEDRALSIREGASLQSFPKSYKFFGESTSSIARIIGNAVPPEYAKRIGKAIINSKSI